mgnify:CR=1 FL=1
MQCHKNELISRSYTGIKEMILENVSRDRNNNLNLLRFVSAVMVIFFHAHPLGYGGEYMVFWKLNECSDAFWKFGSMYFFLFQCFFLI